jgi:hypothetical protein
MKKRKPSLAELLGPLPEALRPLAIAEELPPTWNGPHVGLRIVDGFKTLALMPMRDRAGMRAAWPQ